MAWVAVLLLVTAFAGLWRVLQGPSTTDRMLGLQMTGTTGIALLLTLAQWLDQNFWRDVALVLALLAAVISAALVQLLRQRRQAIAQADEGRDDP